MFRTFDVEFEMIAEFNCSVKISTEPGTSQRYQKAALLLVHYIFCLLYGRLDATQRRYEPDGLS